MSSINKIYLLGTLGGKPTLSSTRNGKPFCKLRVATDNVYTPSGSDEETRTTDWHSVHVFGRQAETSVQYLDKGRQVLVEGRLFSQTFGEGEKKKWMSWINADRVTFVGSRKQDDFALDKERDGENLARFEVRGDEMGEIRH